MDAKNMKRKTYLVMCIIGAVVLTSTTAITTSAMELNTNLLNNSFTQITQ